MPAAILDAQAQDPTTRGHLVNPIAGVACFLAIGWGPGTKAQITTTLSISGATIDTAYGTTDPHDYYLSLGSLVGINMHWHPDGVPVYLNSWECAYGIWKVTFPAAQAYTISLSTVGTTPITAIAAPASPAAPSYPTTAQGLVLQMLNRTPLGLVSSVSYNLSFNGTYPVGGFLLNGNQLGIATPFFGHVQDTATLRFAYDARNRALRVYNSSGEVSGALNFSTVGLFHGSAN